VLYRLADVHVAFATREVLRGVDFQHNPGEKLILLGRNGCGKTTLVRVIEGSQEIESGVLERARNLEIAVLVQRLQAAPGTTVLDFCLSALPGLHEIEAEIAGLEADPSAASGVAVARLHELHEQYDHIDGYRARPRAQAALEGLGIPLPMHGRALDTLSGGERTRAALARALLSPAEMLILDEPTNHLDLVGVEFLAQELAQRKGALLLITHDRELVDRVDGEVLELHGGRIERYPAGFERYRREREARRAHTRKAWQLQQEEIARQEEFIRRNMAGQNTKQAQARQKLLARLERLEAPEPDLPPVRLRWPATGRSGDRVLDVEGLTLGWGGPIASGVSFGLRRGERLAVVGRNGAGKTTLLHTLAGRIPALSGRMRFGAGVVPGWYDQENAEIPPGMSVLTVLLEARPDWTPADGRAWAGRFGFSGEAADADTATLSGGERARLALARLLALAPNLLILDEPTNHLDLITCEVLEQALLEYPGAVVLVSHDRRLVERVATNVLLLSDGRATPLNRVDEAFALLGLAVSAPAPKSEAAAAPRRSAAEEERRKLRRDATRARGKADTLAEELHVAEDRLREVETELCEREVYSNAERAGALVREGEELRRALEELTDTWVTAEEDAEALEHRLAELS
jgi:ATP-binding cassette subfamily F protein 3